MSKLELLRLSNLEFLTCHNLSCSYFEFWHHLSFWVLSQLNFWVLSQLEFLSFVMIWFFFKFFFFTIWDVDFCHNLIVWLLSQQLKFLSFDTIYFFFSFVTILFFEFFYSHNLSFWVLSQFEFLSLVIIEFLSFVPIWVFEFFTIWVFEFGPNLSFCLLSQYLR